MELVERLGVVEARLAETEAAREVAAREVARYEEELGVARETVESESSRAGEAEGRVRALETDLRGLRERAGEVERSRVELVERLGVVEARLAETEAAREVAAREVARYEEELGVARETVESESSRAGEAEGRVRALETDLRGLRERAGELEAARVQVAEQLASREAEREVAVGELEAVVAAVTARAERAEVVAGEVERSRVELVERLGVVEARLAETEAAREVAAREVARYEEELGVARETVESESSRAGEAEGRVRALETDLRGLRERAGEVERSRVELVERLGVVEARLAETEAAREVAAREVARYEEALGVAREAVESESSRAGEAEGRVRALEGDLRGLRERAGELEAARVQVAEQLASREAEREVAWVSWRRWLRRWLSCGAGGGCGG